MLLNATEICKKYNIKAYQVLDYWRQQGYVRSERPEGSTFHLYDDDSVNEYVTKKNNRKEEIKNNMPVGILCKCCNTRTIYSNTIQFVKHHLQLVHNIDSYKDYHDQFLLKDVKERYCHFCGAERKFKVNGLYSLSCTDAACRMTNYSGIEKTKVTKLAKYGDAFFTNKEKREKTKLAKYGDVNYTNVKKIRSSWDKKTIDEVKEVFKKVRKTKLEKYGDETYSNREKISEAQIKRYLAYLPESLALANCSFISYNNLHTTLKCEKNHICEVSTKFLFSRLVNKHSPCTVCFPVDNTSIGSQELYNFIKSNYSGTILENDRKVLGNLELDILLPELNLAFEFDGTYWHSDKFKTITYHKNKTIRCTEKGIRLIHVFEDQWKNKKEILYSKIKNLLNSTSIKIHARKCVIKEPSIKEQVEFLELNHIQGYTRSKCSLGLYNNDNLVGLMTFNTPNTNKKYEWELIRYATILGTSVIGGASKLLTHFKRQFTPKNILSYADSSWSVGNLYEKLGFTLDGVSAPSYFYVKKNNLVRYHRFSLRKEILIHKYDMDPILTEKQMMEKINLFFKIYDCGKLRYVWNNV